MKKFVYLILLILIPNNSVADGKCKNFSDCVYGLFFVDPQVRILGGWKAERQEAIYHFSPGGYVDYYFNGTKTASGYWGAERSYPQFGMMDLNITLEIDGKKKTTLYLADFSGTQNMTLTFMERSKNFGYVITDKKIHFFRVN